MSRFQTTFDRLQEQGERALVGFITAGDPTVSRSMEIVEAMLEAGTDVLELGVPFSDPTADGPVIQRSSGRALQAGVNMNTVLEMTREIRRKYSTPIVLFSYYNPIFAYGGRRFYDDAVAAGADGVLVVDLPPEEAAELTGEWPGQELALIRLIAPTTPVDRIAAIAAGASGFLYMVSMTGVTGSAGLDVSQLSPIIKAVRSVSQLPVCVGFGVSTPQDAESVARIAEGVVVGSAFERIVEENLEDSMVARKVGEAARALKDATRRKK